LHRGDASASLSGTGILAAGQLTARLRSTDKSARGAIEVISNRLAHGEEALLDIAENVGKYFGDRSPTERAASFDYCFNYFQGFRVRDEIGALASPLNIEVSCLHLGYYLASWGMLRGSTVLHTKSYRFFVPVIHAIARESRETWRIDVDKYTDANIADLMELRNRIGSAMAVKPQEGNPATVPTETLVTKVILGVFGSVPAFDTFFRRGFRTVTGSAVKMDPRALGAIRDFYTANAVAVDQQRARTLDFASGRPTPLRYTRAKVIDMVFLIEGGGS
jgi:hypothetical protein